MYLFIYYLFIFIYFFGNSLDGKLIKQVYFGLCIGVFFFYIYIYNIRGVTVPVRTSRFGSRFGYVILNHIYNIHTDTQ